MVAELHDILTATWFIIRGEAYCSTNQIDSPLNQYVHKKVHQPNDSNKEKPQDCCSDADGSQDNRSSEYFPQVYKYTPLHTSLMCLGIKSLDSRFASCVCFLKQAISLEKCSLLLLWRGIFRDFGVLGKLFPQGTSVWVSSCRFWLSQSLPLLVSGLDSLWIMQ